MRKLVLLTTILCAPTLLTGCLSLKLGANMSEPPTFKMNEKIASGFADVNGIRPFDGTIAELHLLDSFGQNGELGSIGIWPLGELGIGLLGARAQILPLEAGGGVLFYTPEPHGGGPGVEADVTVKSR